MVSKRAARVVIGLLLIIITFILVILKMVGIINSWLIVAIPTFVYIGLFIVLIILFIIFSLIQKKLENK